MGEQPTRAGWYNDPNGVRKHQAYWDGNAWSGQTRPDPSLTRRATNLGRLAVAATAISVMSLGLIWGDGYLWEIGPTLVNRLLIVMAVAAVLGSSVGVAAIRMRKSSSGPSGLVVLLATVVNAGLVVMLLFALAFGAAMSTAFAL